MTWQRRVALVLWIALKLVLIAQFASPARDFLYEGF